MKLSRKAYDYINNSLNYDVELVMEKLVENIEELKVCNKHTVSLDECSINWGDDFLMDAEDFVKQLFKQAVELVINVVESFEEEEINE